MVNSTYLISEGFKNVFKNKKSSLTSLITMIIAMFIFGVAFAIGENANTVVEQVSTSQGIQVFMIPDATGEQEQEIEEKIWEIGKDKIATVEYVSKQQALEKIKESFEEDSEWIFAGYEGENNIFPASYIVKLTDLSYSQEVEEKISTFDNIDGIRSSNETIDILIKIARGLRIAVLVAVVLLLIMAITIIGNTNKLTVYSRRKQISIMKYVGATNGFIRGPFVVEGIIIGLAAAVITFLLLAGAYNFVIEKIGSSDVLQRMQISMLTYGSIAKVIGGIFLALGIGIGIVGSARSMRKYLDV